MKQLVLARSAVAALQSIALCAAAFSIGQSVRAAVPPNAIDARPAAHGLTALRAPAASRAGTPEAPPAPDPAEQPRISSSLGSGWRFRQATDLTGVESGTFDDSDWDQVNVPHTWNRIGNEGTERSPSSNNVQGTGWYRLRFRVPGTDLARAAANRHAATGAARYFLEFDAVGSVADVWLNGHYLGKHEGAFARFRFDASAWIKPSGDNLLVVKADNSRPQPASTTANVIPLSGDFFVFGGIYRAVGLIVTRPVHVDMLDFGGPGVYARAVRIEPASAAVQVTARLVNDAPLPQRVLVETEIVAADGTVVAAESNKSGAAARPGAVTLVTANLNIANPRLWQGVRDPYLYRTIVTLRSPQGAILDRVTQPLGLRSVTFDSNQGFFLNGEHLYLKGASMHQDRPLTGWAISAADQDEDFNILADMGANAVRLAHYQHDQRSYDLADSHGIVAWAEIPLVNKVSFDGTAANAALAANARQQLIELIRQNYNHPAIAVWSIANEIDLTATQVKGPSSPSALLRSLDALAKTEDPARTTTFADCCEVDLPPHAGGAETGSAPRDQIVGIADTIGYNRYFGWYTGHFGDFGVMLDQAHLRHPQLPMSVSEYGAGAALTQHSDDPAGGPINPHGRPHPEEFQALYHEMAWSTLRQRGYLWGSFIWNLFDFSSDSRMEGDLTDINEKGLVSYDRRTRKDAFYFYRANWSEEPTLHLVGRRYVDRAYSVLDVKAYSNAPNAGLAVNGSAWGVTACTGGICIWRSVHLDSGVNELHATAEVRGKKVQDTLQWTFTGSPAIVRIKAGDISGYTAADGQRYGSDAYFTGGDGKGVNHPDTPADKRTDVAATDGRMYDSFREGAFSYRVPVPAGRYKIVAKFEEPAASAAGERVFNVGVNGTTVLKRFDIFAAAGGKLKAVDRAVEAQARDGVLVIDFQPIRGQALVAALSITPIH